uniref:Ferritin n=1 Tax=Wollemia nobilis TaxID=56998 RepID=A0A0C9QQB5_9CONI
MLLRAPVAVSAAAVAPLKQQDGLHSIKFVGDKVNLGMRRKMNRRCALHYSASSIRAMADDVKQSTLSGIVFEPFVEVQHELAVMSQAHSQSLARQKYSDPCEAELNGQINVEYNVSYVYHALFAFFDRDNVALPGFAKFFKDFSDEEREHAEMLMKYQNMRGGKVKMYSMLMPVMEFDNDYKGDALHAMELALSLEKLTNEKLLYLHSVAQEANDAQMMDFIEGSLLTEQVKTIKQVSDYVAQLRRIGKGHGVWHFDQMLLNDGAADAAANGAGGVGVAVGAMA